MILCLDDEKIILDSLKAQLKGSLGHNFVYEFAQSAEEAYEIIEESADDNLKILIIISDWLMPGVKGDEFLIKIHQKHPNIVKMLLTGQADQKAVQRAYEQANLFKCIRKPWDKEVLLAAIEEGLQQNP